MCITGGKRCASYTRNAYAMAETALPKARADEAAARDALRADVTDRQAGGPDARDRTQALTQDLVLRMRAANVASADLNEARIAHAQTPKGRAEVSDELDTARGAGEPHEQVYALQYALTAAAGRNAAYLDADEVARAARDRREAAQREDFKAAHARPGGPWDTTPATPASAAR